MKALVLPLLLLCAFAPPSGRPPIGCLQRVEPRVYDLSFAVTMATTQQPYALDKQKYDLVNAPIVFPLIFLGTYNRIDSKSVTSRLWLDGRESDPKPELKEGFQHGIHLNVLTIDRFQGQSLRWQVGYNVQVWSSAIDEKAAMKIAWPQEWPKEVRDALAPQQYIESDDPMFAEEVQKASQGQLRSVPVYLAAKDLVRHCINQVQVTIGGTERGEQGLLRCMVVKGARESALKGMASPHDLVCVCVATLRAAGIPARPVIGAEDDEKGRAVFVSWAEFYLPDAGWVPFDPNVMRGKGIRNMNVRNPWPEFGTMKDLNKRIPLSYHFMPPASVETPRCPAVWGWDPRPHPDPGSWPQVNIGLRSRGRGTADPD